MNAQAASSEWVASDNIKVRIVYEDDVLGVEIEPDAGWHFYAEDAGDAGIPTEFVWEGVEVTKMIFPAHKTFDEYGITTYGFDERTKFVALTDLDETVGNVVVQVTGAVCHEVCVPFDMSLEYDLGAVVVAEPVEKKTDPGEQFITFGIIWTAFLAGLVLNVMPCVLPVLSLKVLSLVKQSGKEFAQARVNFLATALGIIASFLVLAGGAVALKASGETLGWGLHFQSPIFIGILFALVLLFALSLLGVFHLRVPSWVSDQGSHANSLAGNFVTGMLATLLGTACTAPVLVTAVGFALAGSAVQIFVIFGVMGIGMALPYLLFAVFPQLSKFLPRPGMWMVWVKNVMAVLLLATAVWLGTILYAQLVDEMEEVSTSEQLVEWVDFDEAAIANYVADGRVVFVDVTAKWCVNCQVNKLNVTGTDEIEAFFAKENVVLMRGDMTRPSVVLLDYIRQFGRTGIPFNAIYGAGGGDVVLLSPILSKDEVRAAVLAAKNNK